MELLNNAPVPLDWAGYCALPEASQLLGEQRADALNQSMLYLMNLKNENTKKDLYLSYFQGNTTAYPPNIESMARYLLTQYPNNKLTNQHGGKKGGKRKEDESKSEDNDSITGGTAGAHIEDTTTNEDTTAPSRGASLGSHFSESNQALPLPSRTVDGILGAHPINDDSGTTPIPLTCLLIRSTVKKRWRGAILSNSTQTKKSNLL